MQSKLWQPLKPGDTVDLVAPASRFDQGRLERLSKLLADWGLKLNIPADIFGDDILCANSDAKRFELLKDALYNSASKAIICGRGGYGSMRLIPLLATLKPPTTVKLFIGMSDITALHIFFQQQWGWATLHAAPIPGVFADSSIELVRQIVLGEKTKVVFDQLTPLNKAAQYSQTIDSVVVGGNLTLIETGLGTLWQLNPDNKILFLEETGERAYKVDRKLEHLRQAGLLNKVKAIIFGDFTKGEEPNGTSLIEPVLRRFAESLTVPVLQQAGIGHDPHNDPLPLNAPASLDLGAKAKLAISISA